MKGAITRTARQIQREKREKDLLLERYRKAPGITYSIHLLNAAVIAGIPALPGR
jgi:hypothetical protein